jgi:hypothetical protein
MTSYSLVDWYRFEGTIASIFRAGGEGSKFLWNVGTHVRNHHTKSDHKIDIQQPEHVKSQIIICLLNDAVTIYT